MSEQDQSDQHRDDQRYDDQHYDVPATQDKWRKVWDDLNQFQAADDGVKERRYALTMFTYPSGDLHMGHAEVMALHDVIARYWWQRGYDVLNPIGWDSFGLPAENAAIKRDEHPATYTYANIETQAESFRRYGIAFDWSRRLHTSDPEYYRWTQWLFLRFRERGLAYRKFSPVNWCPNDQTVLANEQVVNGMCERCGAEVTKRELSQWYFKVTEYAQRLLDDMEQLEGHWPERVLALQRNWIGRSVGAHIHFDLHLHDGTTRPLTVYTTRPDTVYGATYMVVAPDSKLAAEIVRTGAARGPRGLPGRGPQGDRHRAAVHRPHQDRCRPGRHRDQPGDRRAGPGVGRRLRAGRLRHRRDHGGARARPARPGLRQEVRPARTSRRRHRRGQPGGDVRRHQRRRGLRQLRRPGRAERQECRHRRDHRAPGDRRPRRGCRELPAARLAAVPAALLGRADPDHPLSRLRRGAGARRPAAGRAARAEGRRPEAEGPLAAGRRRGLGERRVPVVRGTGQAGHRHHGHVRGLVVVLPALLLAALRRRPVRRRGGPRLDAGRPVRRRGRARDPAPAVQPVLHQGAARHGHGRLHRAVHGAAEPGLRDQPRPQDEQVPGQRRRPGGAAGGLRRGRRPADAGLRRPARGRHRLGRPVARRLAEVPAARVAAERRRHLGAGHTGRGR